MINRYIQVLNTHDSETMAKEMSYQDREEFIKRNSVVLFINILDNFQFKHFWRKIGNFNTFNLPDVMVNGSSK